MYNYDRRAAEPPPGAKRFLPKGLAQKAIRELDLTRKSSWESRSLIKNLAKKDFLSAPSHQVQQGIKSAEDSFKEQANMARALDKHLTKVRRYIIEAYMGSPYDQPLELDVLFRGLSPKLNKIQHLAAVMVKEVRSLSDSPVELDSFLYDLHNLRSTTYSKLEKEWVSVNTDLEEIAGIVQGHY